jgi:diadenosine tetraphosphate (Ap4A) HIT family hydrolase
MKTFTRFQNKRQPYLFKVVKRVAHAVNDSFKPEGIRIVQNNGEAAGQVVFHLHVHVIPMKPNDHFGHQNIVRSADLLNKDAETIRQRL